MYKSRYFYRQTLIPTKAELIIRLTKQKSSISTLPLNKTNAADASDIHVLEFMHHRLQLNAAEEGNYIETPTSNAAYINLCILN